MFGGPMARKAANPSAKTSKGTPRGSASPRARAGAKRAPKAAPPAPSVTADTLIDGVGVVLALGGFLTFLMMLPGGEHALARPWLELLVRLFGVGTLGAPAVMLSAGLWLMVRRFRNAPPLPWYRLFGLALIGFAFFGLLGLVQQWRDPAGTSGYGGLAGRYALLALELALGRAAAPIAFLFMGVLGTLFLFELSLADLARLAQRLRPRPKPLPVLPLQLEPAPPARPSQLALPAFPSLLEQARIWWEGMQARRLGGGRAVPAATPSPVVADLLAPDPALATPWALPPWRDLLEDAAEQESNLEDIRVKTATIEETLSHFGVPARVVEINRGPTVTQYGVEPGFLRRRVRGEERELKVKVSAITNLHNDLALALAAPASASRRRCRGARLWGSRFPTIRPTPSRCAAPWKPRSSNCCARRCGWPWGAT